MKRCNDEWCPRVAISGVNPDMTPCDGFNLHPPTYKTIMIILSALTPPVNIFAIYCIIRKSTRQMGSYKWFLLAYQSTSTTFDFSLTTLVLPVVFFPIPMGYADSVIARWLSLSTNTALFTVVMTVVALTTCIVALFMYRLHVIIAHHHFLKFSHRGHALFATAFAFVFCGPVIASLTKASPDQSEARKWVLVNYPCAEFVIDAPRLHIYTRASIMHLAVTGVVEGALVSAVILCAILLTLHFLGKNNHLSQKTKIMQKRFLIYLCVQAAVPSFSLLAPVILILSSELSQLRQDLGCLTFCFMAMHGFTSPLSVILCNDAYRASAFTLLEFRCVRKNQNGIVSVSEQNVGRSSLS
ncbi:hypothetical protein Y032_0352g3280 [Ancylostoma ceylanicum]|uniref:G-protein coupled receptors family 1 profile domain-containing protein n=1 Tax=Ancylostoma ceylanicum TaxID=53326 RepID=A0A016RWN5_9BILA|nr:hypothetical protein Y032_0352g3280 [Ancylostoma ceylanicum]